MGLYYVIWVSVYLICNIFLWKYVILQNISNSNSNKQSYHSTCTVAKWLPQIQIIAQERGEILITFLCLQIPLPRTLKFANMHSPRRILIAKHICKLILAHVPTISNYFALKCRIMKVIQIIVHHQVPPLKLRTLLISACASMVKGETN